MDGMDFDIPRFSIRQSAVRLGCAGEGLKSKVYGRKSVLNARFRYLLKEF